MALIPNMELFKANNIKTENGDHSLINAFFDEETLKMLYYHACRVDIADNNDKAEMIRDLLGATFIELGTGTNRIALLHNGVVVKIALDRRGLIDNFTEYKRSGELPEYLAKVYESNMLINIEEYVTVMDLPTFMDNKDGIIFILSDLSRAYLFDDMGYSKKNYQNWGFRSDTGDIVVLDYGYLYPLKGQEMAVSCPKCKAALQYNSTFTGFTCSNKSCNTKYRIIDIMRRRNLDMENFENNMISSLENVEMPDTINNIMSID